MTASPLALPSNACGGFHLKVINEETQDVTVTINDSYEVKVRAGASETVVEWLPPQKPLMPWTVVVTSSTGVQIGTDTFTGPVDQKLTVSSGQLTTEPYDIQIDDC